MTREAKEAQEKDDYLVKKRMLIQIKMKMDNCNESFFLNI